MWQARDYRRKHQAGAGVHCQKQEADSLKMCLDEGELTMTIFAILIPTMVASIILARARPPRLSRKFWGVGDYDIAKGRSVPHRPSVS